MPLPFTKPLKISPKCAPPKKKHYFFGNSEAITSLMIGKLNNLYPEIKITGYLCPEFISSDELVAKYKDEIEAIDADIVWVSLGFPKQEIFFEIL